MHTKKRIRIGAAPPPPEAPLERRPYIIGGARKGRLTGSIVVSISDGKRSPAARSTYHELGPDLEPRAGVHRIRDMGADAWPDSVSVILAPSHDCRLSDLVHGTIDRLEASRGESVQWSAWAHRDTDHPHAHLVVRYDGEPDRRRLEREIHEAAGSAYREIRELQREYARELERDRGPELEP